MDLQGTPVGSGQVPPIQSQPSGSSGAESLWIPVAEPQGGRGLEYLRPLEVQSPPGTTIGYVIQNWSLCQPTFTIQNENDQDVFLVTRTMGLCSPLSFKDFLFYKRNG
ncbi:phospholipid scramblase 1-like isoform X1 [Pelobates fuscus]|uniref:phospholipid scramblase 1-like isoform X1 n=1 Tax=Pelobates fuscus TaxID=191477 RepID=UPI002FE48109